MYVTAVAGEFKERLLFLCIDPASGRRLWQRELQSTHKLEDNDRVSRGAPTPAVDAERVYLLYESGDLLAIDKRTGKNVWRPLAATFSSATAAA